MALHTVVRTKSGFIEPQSGTMRFQIELPNDGGDLVPGARLAVELELSDG